MRQIAVGCDHRGLDYKKQVLEIISGLGYQGHDLGTFTTDSVDYPDVAKTVAEAVAAHRYDLGILICGTGIGVSIAANKVTGIRAALCCDAFMAGRARSHNDANILCLGAERGLSGVEEILKTFLTTPFEGGRHQVRVDKMSRMDDEC
jgi:ribose 5-phosphate isomerase B